MSYIEIDKNPVIFDDPEYCNIKKPHFIECEFIYKDSTNCIIFNNDNEICFKTELIKKCDECKTAWKKAKDKSFNPLNHE